MTSNPTKTVSLIVCSLLMAAVLELLPLPSWAISVRPEWSFLVLLFWLVAQPQYVGVLTAFFLGIFMDLLMGTLLGQHALAFTVSAYLLIRLQYRFQCFSLREQLMMVFILMLLQLSVQFCTLQILACTDRWNEWMSALTSVLIWPWSYTFLRDKHEMIGGR